jgi:glycosyltransferase involved in cell wall biosynthesis
MKKFAVLFTTKNRKDALIFTLQKIGDLIDRPDVECIVCDDASTDGTSEYLALHYPTILLLRNETTQGLIFSRNRLMAATQAEYAISLDDDLHCITQNPLEKIEHYFRAHPECSVLSFRIFWSIHEPESTETQQKPHRVKSFAGGAHVWRVADWYTIPPYPEWFFFYGEEDFASYHLFKINKQVHYFPEILVNHRVDLLARKKNADYHIRLRRSLRSGWYLYFLFYPKRIIPNRLAYTIWIQLSKRIKKGDWKALIAIFQALCDVLRNFGKLMKNSNRFSNEEYRTYFKLPETQLYWKPTDEHHEK